MSSLLPGQMLGSYQIISQVGQGGMATVYKAYHAAMDRYVAVKVLPHQFMHESVFLGRFQQEAHLIAKLEHAHILPIYDYGESEGLPYLVMRFLYAGTLKQRMRSSSPAAVEKACLSMVEIDRIFTQLADALSYAHDQGVIHRDIKPSNIMLDQRGDVFLTDFGIAKLVESTAEFTTTGSVTGTLAYMSPEQAQGQKVDKRTDIYSLGVVLYEMLTGKVPYEADITLAVILKKLQEPLPPPSSINTTISPIMEAVVRKALATNLNQRFNTIQEFWTTWRQAFPAVCAIPQAPPGLRHKTQNQTRPRTLQSAIPTSTPRRIAPRTTTWLPLVLIAVAIITVIGCIVLGGGGLFLGFITGKPTVTSSLEISDTVGGTPHPSISLPFQDNFSDPTTAFWPRVRNNDEITDFENEGYRIWVNRLKPMLLVSPGLQFSDAQIEVDANKIGGPDENRFGVLCRLNKAKRTTYIFTLTSDGYYSVGKLVGDEQKLIGMDNLKQSYDIRHGEATNRLRATCVGDTLSLFINGQMQIEVHDSEFQSGDMGLWAGTASRVGTDILFDNLSVTLPGSPANPKSEILFRDDFSNTNGTWITGQYPEGIYGMTYGGFRFMVNKTKFDYWTSLQQDFKYVIIEVEATKLGGAEHNLFWVICRFRDPHMPIKQISRLIFNSLPSFQA